VTDQRERDGGCKWIMALCQALEEGSKDSWDRLIAANPGAAVLNKAGRSTVAKTPRDQPAQVVELLDAKQA
jgi:hypothetical protein